MTDPFATLPGTLDAVWARLLAGCTDRTAPARHPVLATVGANGAEARMVVLRAADRSAATLELYTDRHSAKTRDLAAEPRASLLVWDPAAMLQIRLRARFALIHGPEVVPRWDALPDPARALYGGTPMPGTPMARPEDHTPGGDPGAFCVLRGRLSEIETLRIGTHHHRRARFDADSGWTGQWCAP